MKKTIILALLTVICGMSANAQSSWRNSRNGSSYGYSSRRTSGSYGYSNNYNRSYVGLRIGGAFSTVNSDDKYLDGGKSMTGLDIGIVTGMPITSSAPLYFETGLEYVEKGGKSGKNSAFDKMTYSLNYLEVPLTLKYICNVDRNLSIQPYAGGYLACGVGGKIKDFGDRVAYSSFGEKSYNFQRFDGGLKVGCGVGVDMFYADLSYDIGLANISHDDFDQSKTGSLQLTVGVNF